MDFLKKFWNSKPHVSSTSTVRGEVDGNSTIKIYKNTQDPTGSWDELKVKQTVNKVTPLPLDTPIYPDKLRFVCLSDTHAQTHRMSHSVPPGDVLLHAGDFTNVGKMEEVVRFNEFLGEQPHTHKVVIAGNHDLTFDDYFMVENTQGLQRFGVQVQKVREFLKSKNVEKTEELLTDCIYLRDSGVTVCGVQIYGSPWQPFFGDWGFNLQRGQECLDKWNLIPAGVDVLMTHGPPIGHGDLCSSHLRAGCVELLHTVQQRVKPRYHVFGHIHEAYGATTDGFTTYINASICTLRYAAVNAPIIFDVPIPPGHSKDDPFRTVAGAPGTREEDGRNEEQAMQDVEIIGEGDQLGEEEKNSQAEKQCSQEEGSNSQEDRRGENHSQGEEQGCQEDELKSQCEKQDSKEGSSDQKENMDNNGAERCSQSDGASNQREKQTSQGEEHNGQVQDQERAHREFDPSQEQCGEDVCQKISEGS